MEGKFAIMSVVLVSLLVLGQIQVEAQTLRSCCPSTSARNIYNTCRFAGGSQSLCASTSGCRRLATCPAGWTNGMLENTGKAASPMEVNAVFKSCCPDASARTSFDICRATAPVCAKNAGCKLYPTGLTCPTGWTYDMLGNTVNDYCKSGCLSSVCSAITTLKNSDTSEVVDGAVEKCTAACSDFCTKKASITTVV